MTKFRTDCRPTRDNPDRDTRIANGKFACRKRLRASQSVFGRFQKHSEKPAALRGSSFQTAPERLRSHGVYSLPPEFRRASGGFESFHSRLPGRQFSLHPTALSTTGAASNMFLRIQSCCRSLVLLLRCRALSLDSPQRRQRPPPRPAIIVSPNPRRHCDLHAKASLVRQRERRSAPTPQSSPARSHAAISLR